MNLRYDFNFDLEEVSGFSKVFSLGASKVGMKVACDK